MIKMQKRVLIQLCQEHNLPSYGTNFDLIEHLLNFQRIEHSYNISLESIDFVDFDGIDDSSTFGSDVEQSFLNDLLVYKY